jgi:hypothetical protein
VVIGFRRFLGLMPGIVLLAILGYAGKVTEQSIARYGKAHHLFLPNIEYVLWAIVFGLIVLPSPVSGSARMSAK